MEIKQKVFCVDKPINWTSNDVVQFIKHKYKFKKVGHAGTLDPLATGVLVLGVNEGTKQLFTLIQDDKTYVADITFGIETTTYDAEGQIIKEIDASKIHIEQIEEMIKNKFLNDYKQFPPIYSAIKVNGKKLYDYARNNKQVQIKPRDVKLFSYKTIKYINNTLTIELKVSKGFYIRSFAHDLGLALNNHGYISALKRIKSGTFELKDCLPIEFN